MSWLGIIGLLIAAIMGLGIFRSIRAWLRYRGECLITCPENLRPAGVKVDVGRAAGHLWYPAELRLSQCSRWPERAGCGQECLAQIQAAPGECQVRNILARWYEGKGCATCGRPFGEIDWAAVKPALITAEKITVEWGAVPVPELPRILETALPVCFACHMANTLVREHPGLAIDRQGRNFV